MQAPPKSNTAVAPLVDARATLLRTIVAVVATLMLLMLFRPTIVAAQSKTNAHTVVAGESLWSLATQFYGDGQKWLDLAKLNNLGDSGEKQLVVGQVIKVPAEKPVVVGKPSVTPPANTPRAALMRALQPSRTASSAASTTASNTAAPAGNSGALASQTAGKTDAAPKPAASTGASAGTAAPARTVAANPASSRASGTGGRGASGASSSSAPARTGAQQSSTGASGTSPTVTPVVDTTTGGVTPRFAQPVASTATRIWGSDLPALRDARGSEQETIFLGRTVDLVETDRAVQALLPAANSRERSSEYSSAPYVVAANALATAGMVGRRASSAGAGFRGVERLLLLDEAEVTLPSSLNASVGARFVSVDAGTLLPNGAQVVVPTGVLQIVKVEVGQPVIARVVRQSGRIDEGQHLVPLEGNGISNGVMAKPVPRSATPPETEVVWVEGALIPTIQSYVVLGAGEREGVKVGDEYALVTRQGVVSGEPETRVAIVRVVRVTQWGSSAMVVRQDAPNIAVGIAARLVARVQ